MQIRVKEIMDSNPLILSENDLLSEVYCLLKGNIGAIVTNKLNFPVGIITPLSFYNQINNFNNCIYVKDIMTREIKILNAEDIVETCTSEQELWPILENGSLIGAVYLRELIRYWKDSRDINICYLDHTLEHCLTGIIIVDNYGRVKSFNQVAKKLFNITKDSVIGEKISDIIPATGLLHVLESGKPQDYQRVSIGEVTIIVNRRPILRNEQIIGAISIFHDISQQELLNHNLEITKKFNDELESIIDACSEGIYISDGQGVGLRVNKSYERITGVEAKELLGKNMAEVVEQGLVSNSVTLKVLAEKETVTIAQHIKGREFLVTGIPILNEQGQITRVVTTVRDVTELNRLNLKISEMNERSQKYHQELMLLRHKKLDTGELVVKSKIMKTVVEMAFRVAQFDSTCLLLGESGVGKDVIARLIHVNSARNKNPFIKINCGAIPRELLEAELFGYEAGAFTGARKEGKPGMFELAHQGTLFLDEIGEMPLDLQVKILQAIQDRAIYRVGGTKCCEVDIRIIAATNRNLESMVRKGSFRYDLYYRLNIISIEIPPLRERTEDIIPLVQLNLEKLKQQYGNNKHFSPAAIQCLLNYQWPGNVRELRNIIERSVVICSDDIITPAQLPEKVFKSSKIPIRIEGNKKLKEAVEEVEKYMILESAKKHKSLSGIAGELGVNKSTVCRKVHMYRLDLDVKA